MSETTLAADVDPKSTLSYRSLKAVVIVLGVLIVLALVLVVVGIGRQMGGHVPGQSSATGTYGLPAGSKILSLQVANNRLIMAVQGTDKQSRVLIFSTDDGHLVGQIVPQDEK